MNINEFADAQKTHNILYPVIDVTDNLDDPFVPFVSLLEGKETPDITNERWKLYNQLYSHFHSKVDNIVSNVEVDLKQKITSLLFDNERSERKRETFRTLFLLGSDSTTPIDFKDIDSTTMNVRVDITAKESPNVRMMLRRSMFKLFSTAEENTNNVQNLVKVSQDEAASLIFDDRHTNHEGTTSNEVSYDLSLVENFKLLFGKNLNMVFNFKDVDSFNFQHIDGFLELLKNALKTKHVNIYLVFNINTNLSMIEKNLKQSTLRFLKRNYGILDISSNRGFKYANRIFEGFLDTVDGKLNLSENFIQFILDRMANNTNHNLQLLTKILDYSLMSYFYQNPFAVFIDPVNIEYLDDSYLKLLSKCPTYMFFLDGLIKQGAPTEEISNLLRNKDGAMADFFAEFLVRDNPINRHAKAVATILEDRCNIQNYNLIELYYNLLTDNLDDFLKSWPESQQYKDELAFESVDTIFKELFTLDNNNDLLSEAMFPKYKTNMEDDLLCWEQTLAKNQDESFNELKDMESLNILNMALGPIVGQLFKVYREAPSTINLFDFFSAFKETLPKSEILNFLVDYQSEDDELKIFMEKNNDNHDVVFDKVSLILFMQSLFDFENIGLVKASGKNYDIVDKYIWRGI